MFHQTIVQDDFVSNLSRFNKILNPDQKSDKEISKGDFYGYDTIEVNDVVYQKYVEKRILIMKYS